MNNIITDLNVREFFVWIDLNNFLSKHNYTFCGHFSSFESNEDNLMFLPNPNFSSFISPFQFGLLRAYKAEYDLETARISKFQDYNSRLSSIFLFETESDANEYSKEYNFHVGNRELKKVKTNGSYIFSRHDLTWIDFMRAAHSMSEDTINQVTEAYWTGKFTQESELKSLGQIWNKKSISEILYKGRVDFIY